jgi:hypothetical protein
MQKRKVFAIVTTTLLVIVASWALHSLYSFYSFLKTPKTPEDTILEVLKSARKRKFVDVENYVAPEVTCKLYSPEIFASLWQKLTFNFTLKKVKVVKTIPVAVSSSNEPVIVKVLVELTGSKPQDHQIASFVLRKENDKWIVCSLDLINELIKSQRETQHAGGANTNYFTQSEEDASAAILAY